MAPRVRPILFTAALAVSTVGCMLQGAALDGPIAVELRIETTSSTVEVDAAGWFAERTRVFLCSAEPPLLPEPGPLRAGWVPGPPCHDFGTFAGDEGLRVVLPLETLAGPPWAEFDAAEEWYLYLVEVDATDRVLSAIRSRFRAPRDVVAF